MGIITSYLLTGLALHRAYSDLNEARSLTYENNVIDIYSNSWGPRDNGSIVDGPERLAKMALRNAVDDVSSHGYNPNKIIILF